MMAEARAPYAAEAEAAAAAGPSSSHPAAPDSSTAGDHVIAFTRSSFGYWNPVWLSELMLKHWIVSAAARLVWHPALPEHSPCADSEQYAMCA